MGCLFKTNCLASKAAKSCPSIQSGNAKQHSKNMMCKGNLQGVTYWQSSCSAQDFSTLAQLIPSMAIICSWFVLTHKNGHQILEGWKISMNNDQGIIAVVKQVPQGLIYLSIQKALLHNTELVVLQSDVQNLSWRQRRVDEGPLCLNGAFKPCPINLVRKENQEPLFHVARYAHKDHKNL